MSTDSQPENYTKSSEESVTLATGLVPHLDAGSLIPYKAAILVCAVLGAVSNGLVLGGFALSEKSKMNSSSIHIANHTILEQNDLHLPRSSQLSFS